jgi:hypothetical protein
LDTLCTVSNTGPMPEKPSLARDVAVNVLASLIASAVIAGAAWMLAPGRLGIIICGLLGLAEAGCVAVLVAHSFISKTHGDLLMFVSEILLGVIGVSMAVTLPLYTNPAPENRIAIWSWVWAMSALFGVVGLRSLWRTGWGRSRPTMRGREAFLRAVRREPTGD